MIGKTNASAKGGSASGGTTNPSNGVYILADDGLFYNPDEWLGKYIPVCVAVITDNCQFGIALEEAEIWADSSSQISLTNAGSSLVNTTDKAIAITDYGGVANTINKKSNSSYKTASGIVRLNSAAAAARGYIFRNGRVGYIGSAGEWQAVADNKEAIVNALKYCGGVSLSSYITSTDGNNGWRYNYTSNVVETLGYYNTYGTYWRVRPFCSLTEQLPKSSLFGTYLLSDTYTYTVWEFENGMTWEDWINSEYAPVNSSIQRNSSYKYYVLAEGENSWEPKSAWYIDSKTSPIIANKSYEEFSIEE